MTLNFPIRFYLVGMNTDIDCFWYIYTQKQEDVPDYMYSEEITLHSLKELVDFIYEQDFCVENNFYDYFEEF